MAKQNSANVPAAMTGTHPAANLGHSPPATSSLRPTANEAGESVSTSDRGRLTSYLDLATDHIQRARNRLRALDTLYEAESWADVVGEADEVVELTLRGLLHAVGVEPPRTRDVAGVLEAERGRMPAALREKVEELAAVSRSLRRDRELAFYGAEDLTPSSFYREADASEAREAARFVVASATLGVE